VDGPRSWGWCVLYGLGWIFPLLGSFFFCLLLCCWGVWIVGLLGAWVGMVFLVGVVGGVLGVGMVVSVGGILVVGVKGCVFEFSVFVSLC
jgi:hypothetical protein